MFNIADFVDPMQAINSSSKRVLVTRTRRSGFEDRRVGMEVDVKYPEASYNGVWYVDESGNYVTGAPVNPAYYKYEGSLVLVTDDSGLVTLGRTSDVHDAETVKYLPMRRSDGKMFSETSRGFTHLGKHWVAAAYWAPEYFPDGSDDPATAQLREEALKQVVRKRRLHVTLHEEAFTRSWRNDLEEIEDEYKLPSAQFSGLVEATAVMRTDHDIAPDNVPADADSRLGGVLSGQRRVDNSAYIARPIMFTTGQSPIGVRSEPSEIRTLNRGDLIDVLRGHGVAVTSDMVITPQSVSPTLHSLTRS